MVYIFTVNIDLSKWSKKSKGIISRPFVVKIRARENKQAVAELVKLLDYPYVLSCFAVPEGSVYTIERGEVWSRETYEAIVRQANPDISPDTEIPFEVPR